VFGGHPPEDDLFCRNCERNTKVTAAPMGPKPQYTRRRHGEQGGKLVESH